MWTKEQLDAINLENCNLLVAAGAGAGKTAVLVERIIRKITQKDNGVDIDRLLIMTFTRAAATEMRERIYNAVTKALDNEPSSKRLQRQLALMNKASITTIHSFCMDVIKNNFRQAGIDPNFRVSDQTETLLLKLETIEELLDSIYEEGMNGKDFLNSIFYNLLESYSNNKDDSALKDMIINIYEFIQSNPWPEKWISEKVSKFDVSRESDFANTKWAQAILSAVYLDFCGIKDSYLKALEQLADNEDYKGYYDKFVQELKMFENVLELFQSHSDKSLNNSHNQKEKLHYPSWNELKIAVNGVFFSRLPSKGKGADEQISDFVKKLRDGVKERINKLWKNIFLKSSEEINDDLGILFPLLEEVSGIVLEFEELYQKKKRQRSVLDFNDLEHFAIKILIDKDSQKPTDIALGYKERYEEILVDEYQDSNLVQEILISAISRVDKNKPNVFMVGDVKQSIYRFRQARPELFLEKYNTYTEQDGDRFRKIKLYKNFRSRKQVIAGVNFIFKQIMSDELGELNYDRSEELISGAQYDELEAVDFSCDVSLLSLDTKNDEQIVQDNKEARDTVKSSNYDGDIEEEEIDKMTAEAQLVSRKILDLITNDSFEVFDKDLDCYRKLEFRDIVILLRATSKWADVFVQELSNFNIPVFADSDTGFFKTMEVNVIASILELIDNPLQDIPLLSVLRSPIYGLTTNELVNLRMENLGESLFEAVKISSENGNEKMVKFLNDLQRWRDKASYLSVDELIWYLYDDTLFFSYVGAMPFGEQRQANLRILFERAKQFESTSFKGLFQFINFLNKLKTGNNDLGSAKILGEKENLVRILSIHKSKGLEFPVVFISGCAKNFNTMDEKNKMILHQDLGFGPDIVDINKRAYQSSIPKEALKLSIKKENLSEELRILYVAMTRAREKLIITGTVKNSDEAFKRWSEISSCKEEKIPPYKLIKAKIFLDYLMPALFRHQQNKVLRDFDKERLDTCIVEDDSRWNFSIYNKQDLVLENKEILRKQNNIQRTVNEGSDSTEKRLKDIFVNLESVLEQNEYSIVSNEIKRRLDWQYTFETSALIPSKISVTELKKRFKNVEKDDEFNDASYISPLVKKPMFLEEKKGLDSAQRGSILHFVMQNIDFENVSDIKSIENQVFEMENKNLLTEIERKSVNIGKVFKFFTSELGKRMLNAKQVKREVPFNLEINSSILSKEMEEDKDETILLQGVIDCFFVDDDGVVLLDYKTDYVDDDNKNEIKQRYRLQMDYYKFALEKLLKINVSERYVYLFYIGEVLDY